MARSRCKAAAASYWRAPRAVRPISREVIDDRCPVVGRALRIFTFVLITLVLGGAGAWATGRAVAKTWRPLATLAPYMVFLAAAVRFLHYALYGDPLLSIPP